MQCLPFLSENRREAFSMFPKRKKFQWFRILGMFSVLWHAQHTRVHRNSQKNESIHCKYICKKNFARGWLLRDFTLERVKDWWCVKDWSLTVCATTLHSWFNDAGSFSYAVSTPYLLEIPIIGLDITTILHRFLLSLNLQSSEQLGWLRSLLSSRSIHK